MRIRWVALMGIAMLAGAVGGSLLSPAPVGAVAREIVELQQAVAQLMQGQQALQTAITQNNAVEKTLLEQSLDSVNKLSATMGSLQKTVQDMQANSGARLDSMATQIQGVSDNMQEMQARMGKLNQQLTDAQTAIQGIDAKLASAAAPPPPAPTPGAELSPEPGDPASTPAASVPPVPESPYPPATRRAPAVPSAAPPAVPPNPAPAAKPPVGAPSADLLYSNGLRDLTSRKYDLAMQEFRDYMKRYPTTDLASNAQFYIGEIYFAQEMYDDAVNAYTKVLDNYPKSFKLAPARLKKGLALAALGQKTEAIRELRAVVRLYAGTEEERRARAKLKELGITA
jgi:tol-pal system protein YbgF